MPRCPTSNGPGAFKAHSPGDGGGGLVQPVFCSPTRIQPRKPPAAACERAAKQKTLYVIIDEMGSGRDRAFPTLRLRIDIPGVVSRGAPGCARIHAGAIPHATAAAPASSRHRAAAGESLCDDQGSFRHRLVIFLFARHRQAGRTVCPHRIEDAPQPLT